MALCGGGCMGFVNVAHGVRAIGYIEPDPIPAGPVAMVTHSGSVFSAVLRARRALGFTVAVSSGQELVTTTPAYLDYALSLAGDGGHRARARDDAGRDRAAGVVDRSGRARHPGRGPAGRHERARPIDGGRALRRGGGGHRGLGGARRRARLCTWSPTSASCSTPSSCLPLVGAHARRAAPASGLAAVLDSGAERALLVDVAAATGVPFAEISRRTRSIGSRERLDPGLIATNPLDVWGNGADTEGLFGDVLVALVRGSGGAGGGARGRPRRRARWRRVLPPRGPSGCGRDRDLPVVVLSHLPAALDLRRCGGASRGRGAGAGGHAQRAACARAPARPCRACPAGATSRDRPCAAGALAGAARRRPAVDGRGVRVACVTTASTAPRRRPPTMRARFSQRPARSAIRSC